MTKAELLQLVDANGGDDHLFCIVFGSGERLRFTKETPFGRSMIETYGETSFIVRNLFIGRRSTHRLSLPVKTYYNMGDIQFLQFVEDSKDKGDVDSTAYTDLH